MGEQHADEQVERVDRRTPRPGRLSLSVGGSGNGPPDGLLRGPGELVEDLRRYGHGELMALNGAVEASLPLPSSPLCRLVDTPVRPKGSVASADGVIRQG